MEHQDLLVALNKALSHKNTIELIDHRMLKEVDQASLNSRKSPSINYPNKLGIAGSIAEPKLFQDFFASLTQTNIPRSFWRWGLLSAVAATVGRNCWLPYSGVDKTYPNLFVILCGEPAVGKSDVIKLMESLMKKSGYKYVTTSGTTKEKFLDDLSKGFGVPNDKVKDADNLLDSIDFLSDEDDKAKVSEGYIMASELESFFSSNNKETTDWSALLRDLYDCPYSIGSKSRMGANTVVKNPVVNILAGTIPLGLKYFYGSDGLMNGLFSRGITCYALPTGITIAHPVYNQTLLDKVANGLADIRNMYGEMSFDDEAKEAYHRIAIQCNDNEGGLLRTWRARKDLHIKKVAMLLAISDLRMVITAMDIYQATMIINYTEDFMDAAVIGCSGSQTANKEMQILGELNSNRIPLDSIQLQARVGLSANNSTQFQDLFLKLHSLTFIREVHTTIRKKTCYYTSLWVLKTAKVDNTNGLWEYGFFPMLEIGKQNGYDMSAEVEQENHL